MGDIRQILAKVRLPPPEGGWDPEAGSFSLPFSVELKEDFHIHWQDIRIEMSAVDFDDFAQAIARAHKLWVQDGKPDTQQETKFYGAWPGEEKFDFFHDRHVETDRMGRLRHQYRLFPRTESGTLHLDCVLQIELQRRN